MGSEKRAFVRIFMNGALPAKVVAANKLPASLRWIFTDEANDRFHIRLDEVGNWIFEPEDENMNICVFTPEVLEWMVMGSKVIKGDT